MNETKPYCKINKKFNFKEFIETNDNSAQRTRWITIVLVVATVIISIGFYNSLDSSWATYRIKALKDFEKYPLNKLGSSNKPILDSLIGKRDFVDFKAFFCSMQSTESVKTAEQITVSAYLMKKFNDKTIKLLKKECAREEFNALLSDQLMDSIKFDFNAIILKDRFLYSPARFPVSDKRTEETRRLLNKGTAKNDPVDNTNIESVESNQNTASNRQSNTNQSGNINSPVNAANRQSNQSNANQTVNAENTKPIESNANQSTENKNEEADSIIELDTEELIRLNRLLLEEIYEPNLYKSQDIIPSSEALFPKEVAAYIAFDDNVQFIEIPFFGIAIDVNDLGLFGGLALITILALLRFSQSREIKNLNISFKEAFVHEELCPFYHALAMRQVLTVPEMEGEKKNNLLAYFSKWILLFPLIVIVLGVWYDAHSVFVLQLFTWSDVWKQMLIQFAFVAWVLYLSLRCVERKIHIEIIWDNYFTIIRETPDSLKKKFKKKPYDPKLEEIVLNHLNTPKKYKYWHLELFSRKYLSRLIPFVKDKDV